MPKATKAAKTNRVDPYHVFYEGLKEKATSLGRKEDCILVLEDFFEDTLTQEQVESIKTIITPKPVMPRFKKVLGELQSVGDMGCIRSVGSYESLEGQDIIKKHLRAIDRLIKANNYPETYSYCVALLWAVTVEDFWYSDTEDDKSVVKIFHKIQQHWKALWELPPVLLGGPDPQDRAVVEGLIEDLQDNIETASIEL
ncbi:hypothetical protein HYH03_013654 [Edaphochlamys debaryana]|uniref:Uncharacterized protein n=1 Tax=Edaphochlamys debaryana TaxID=47281 RepID=A0A836BT07_9CHLO|nr:hypothetical protein HYH03_013654 [Edaphochlamys debaryana]|eukprot:KAG2487810.1 hypothetical protein HYH03_013654 [Edaphochlamys debaryana]